MERLGLQHPIFQAPLAGGGDTPALVAAVSEAGGLGFIGASYLTPQQIQAAMQEVRSRTTKPFGINLFVPIDPPTIPPDHAAIIERMAPQYQALGLPPPSLPEVRALPFREQLSAALAGGASVFSFIFGTLAADIVSEIKSHGLFLMGTATTVEEALHLESTGVDAIVAQGAEAGGHRGTFLGDFEASLVGTMALVPQTVDAVRVPVIAAGGIMDGRGIVAALALGASAVQMGTAFLTCQEAGIPAVYQERILQAHEDETRLTRAFSGRPARGIVNRFMTDMDGPALPFPVQNALTRPLRAEAARLGRSEYLSLWAGQGVRMARRETASQLMARLVREISDTTRRLQADPGD